jgi:Tfp pilus assembly protein PilO
MPPVDLAGLQEVPIELTVAGTIRETVGMLYQIERTPRLLTVKDVKLRVVAVGQPRGLLTTIVVAGYLLPAPAAGSN